MNAVNPHSLGHFNEQQPIIDIDRLLRPDLGNVQGQPKDVLIRFSEADKRRNDKEIETVARLQSMVTLFDGVVDGE